VLERQLAISTSRATAFIQATTRTLPHARSFIDPRQSSLERALATIMSAGRMIEIAGHAAVLFWIAG
jgi:hypothetical protein